MNWKKLVGIVAGIAIVAMVVIRLMNNKEVAKERIYHYDKEETINVQADTIKVKNVSDERSQSGTFEPFKETKLSSETQGKINAVFVEVGSLIKKGQALIQLDNSLLKLQLQSIEVQIEGLEDDVRRYEILAKADAIQGVQLEKAELGLKSANIQKATLLEQINKTTIKAPFDGVITAKFTEEGAFASPGMPLLQITDIAQLKFTVNVAENELTSFKLNQSYTVSSDSYPEIPLTGKAIMIGSKANMGNSFPVQFNVKNTPDFKIKSGMFGKVYSDHDSDEMGIMLTSSAITGTAKRPQVYLVKNGKAVLHDIIFSKRINNKVVVSKGLKEDDVVVTGGFINLFDGANVTIK